jgi:hypothetical protein
VDLAPNLGGVGEAAVVPPEECARAGGGGRQQPLPRQDPAVGGECGDAARESPAPGHAISPPEIAGERGGRELGGKVKRRRRCLFWGLDGWRGWRPRRGQLGGADGCYRATSIHTPGSAGLLPFFSFWEMGS